MNFDIRAVKEVRRRHPAFFWGVAAVLLLLTTATAVVASRIPTYQRQSDAYDEAMTAAERETRDRILNSRARRSQLAVALLEREMRLKALEENSTHLAISTADSTIELRHGRATLRTIRVTIGPDSTVRASDGRAWRLVRALGERHLVEKETNPTLAIPDWVYVSRGDTPPPSSERQVEGGLGSHVLRLDDGTEIHTRPETGPFADGPRPAAFIVEDPGEMRAIFDALALETPVYIY
ncbi:MAG: hypothetical protein WD737_14290 [Gemmatimonadota bacterium]